MTLLFPVILNYILKSCLASIGITTLQFLCVLPFKGFSVSSDSNCLLKGISQEKNQKKTLI